MFVKKLQHLPRAEGFLQNERFILAHASPRTAASKTRTSSISPALTNAEEQGSMLFPKGSGEEKSWVGYEADLTHPLLDGCI